MQRSGGFVGPPQVPHRLQQAQQHYQSLQPIQYEQNTVNMRGSHTYRIKETRNSQQPLASSHIVDNHSPDAIDVGELMTGRIPTHNQSQFVNRKNTLNVVNVRHGQQVKFS